MQCLKASEANDVLLDAEHKTAILGEEEEEFLEAA